jgi:CRISPR system Cascade subunit CasB
MSNCKKSKLIYSYVDRKIEFFENCSDSSKVKADLAKLRRGVGKLPGELPELWGYFLKELPEELQGVTKDPSKSEIAIYLSLVLYALHQQSNDIKEKPMNLKGETLGKGIRKLIPDEDEDAEKRILTRFKRLANAQTMRDVSIQLRSIISLLKSKDIPIDYPDLATDLYFLQNPKEKNKIKMKWAREFYTNYQNKNKEEE